MGVVRAEAMWMCMEYEMKGDIDNFCDAAMFFSLFSIPFFFVKSKF